TARPLALHVAGHADAGPRTCVVSACSRAADSAQTYAMLVGIGAFVAVAATGRAFDLSALIVPLRLRGIVVTNAIVLREIAQHWAGARRARGDHRHGHAVA